MSCSLKIVYRRFGETCYRYNNNRFLFYQGASNETTDFIAIACKPSNHINPEQLSPNITQQSALSKAELRSTTKKPKRRTRIVVLICSFIQCNIDL